jgi:hypothetical protein
MDYIEANKVISPEQEGFRPGRYFSRAITHLSLCIEDAHTHNKDILLAYLDFTQAFPSTDHLQLERTLRFLGIPEDFIFIVAKRSTHHLRNPSRQHPTNTRLKRHSPRGPHIPIPLPTNGRTPNPLAKILSKRLHTHL